MRLMYDLERFINQEGAHHCLLMTIVHDNVSCERRCRYCKQHTHVDGIDSYICNGDFELNLRRYLR